jgi:hypothetical protein
MYLVLTKLLTTLLQESQLRQEAEEAASSSLVEFEVDRIIGCTVEPEQIETAFEFNKTVDEKRSRHQGLTIGLGVDADEPTRFSLPDGMNTAIKKRMKLGKHPELTGHWHLVSKGDPNKDSHIEKALDIVLREDPKMIDTTVTHTDQDAIARMRVKRLLFPNGVTDENPPPVDTN